MTILPFSSAGAMSSAMSCVRAAMKRRSSVAVSIPRASLESTMRRISSPVSTPPGSRVKTVPFGSISRSRPICTDFPDPSPPSSTMNFLRIPLLYIRKLPADNVLRMRFVEELFAAFKEIDVLNARRDHGCPTRLAAPPVAPEVEVGAARVVSVFSCVGNGPRFGVIFWVTAFAQFIPLSCRYPALHALALVCFVILAPVCPAADHFAVLDDQRPRRLMLVDRMLFCICLCLLHRGIVHLYIEYRMIFREVGILDIHRINLPRLRGFSWRVQCAHERL